MNRTATAAATVKRRYPSRTATTTTSTTTTTTHPHKRLHVVNNSLSSEKDDIEDIMSATPVELDTFRINATAWYDKNKRTFSWRQPNISSYGIWVSEVMSQQTRVETVEKYWTKFMTRFPNPAILAQADLDEVNKYWAGLGYYRRASQLHNGAKQVVEEFEGQLPGTSHELMSIKGIGPYTAGAIASISFAERVPAVDGNVIRVLSRWRACDVADVKSPKLAKHVTKLASTLVHGVTTRPGDFNQSIMELGAMICTPKNPSCSSCPLSDTCKAKAIGLDPIAIASRFPAKLSEAKKPSPRVPVLICLIVSSDQQQQQQHVLSMQRPHNGGLLSGQWELCVCEGGTYETRENQLVALKARLQELGLCRKCAQTSLSDVREIGRFTHVFSHLSHECVVITVPFHGINRMCTCLDGGKFKWVQLGKDHQHMHGLTRGMSKALELLVND